ncbi:YbaB/EbfC family nucleoid-associated protein [Pseudonocardia sp.]|uniref:YbaB/EbfC family nucleoid-associated protein n=1 Tax=Pseudonocardia sp. TaxID=60912 RepID=UPI0026198EE8|nr:YbaB/EbfC family nucleoid-associated protein [Pseudonocardia sp.]
MDGREWLDGYQQRLQDIRARAHRVQAELAGVEATATSADGAVTVTAGPGGVLRRVVFDERSEGLSRTQLGAAVVAAVAQAQGDAARRATEALEPLVGRDSEAMRVLRSHLPAAESTAP